ncbi:hypothetical protein DRQ33_03845 [bacterium]|nr:MAG: hypothetical protein DRQ33_03845 [bacterium]
MSQNQIIAVCGLICSECDIFRASENPQIAQDIAKWFKTEQGKDINIENIRCDGCRGNRNQHWSPNCWILKCCVDNRNLDYCYQCEQFPCDNLAEWADGCRSYQDALERLKKMLK